VGGFGKRKVSSEKTRPVRGTLYARKGEMMRIGIAADHCGFDLKAQLTVTLNAAGHEVTDFVVHH